MADRQSLDATFFAFRKRERGGVLLGATLAYGLVAIVLGALFVWLNFGAMRDYMAWTMSLGQQTTVDPSNPFAGMPTSVMSLAGYYFLFLIFFYVLLAAWEAACLRWMIRGETKGFLGLALDGDTWRVYFTYWVWLFLLLAGYFVLALIIIGVGAGAAFGAQGAGADLNATMVLVPIVLVIAALIVLVYLGVRFAPAAATSVAKRRFAFFDAWKVTKGRFWALFGAFVLLWLMYFVGIIILSFIASFAMMGGMMSMAQTGAEPTTPEEMWAMFASPSMLVPLVLVYGAMLIGAFMFYVGMFGVNARAAEAALQEGKITPAA